MQEATFESAGGLPIFYRAWRPHGPPRAIIILNHGVNSHGRQNDLLNDLGKEQVFADILGWIEVRLK